jgi:hypothetical protein
LIAALPWLFALALCACAPEFALQRPTAIRCDCSCGRTPCDEVLLCIEPELEALSPSSSSDAGAGDASAADAALR